MQEKVKKVNNIMGLVRRTYVHLDERKFSKIFTALVRPHLEYANTAWYPTKIKDIIAIEEVQRQATKYLPAVKELSFENIKEARITNFKIQETMRRYDQSVQNAQTVTDFLCHLNKITQQVSQLEATFLNCTG